MLEISDVTSRPDVIAHPDFSGHAEVLYAEDRSVGLRMYRAVAAGPSVVRRGVGGFRITEDSDLLGWSLRLSGDMGWKGPTAGFLLRGCKFVACEDPHATIVDGVVRRTRAFLLAAGRAVAEMNRRSIYACVTGKDAGTTLDDLTIMAEEGGTDVCTLDPGRMTGYALFECGDRMLRHIFRDGRGYRGRTVLVHGAGNVGMPHIQCLFEAGAKVYLYEPYSERARQEAVSKYNVTLVTDLEVAWTMQCDVFASCGAGEESRITEERARRLGCTAVIGCANAQAVNEHVYAIFHQENIGVLRDFGGNWGGLLTIALVREGKSLAEVRAEIARLAPVIVDGIWNMAARHHEPLGHAALRYAKQQQDQLLAEAMRQHPTETSDLLPRVL